MAKYRVLSVKDGDWCPISKQKHVDKANIPGFSLTNSEPDAKDVLGRQNQEKDATFVLAVDNMAEAKWPTIMFAKCPCNQGYIMDSVPPGLIQR